MVYPCDNLGMNQFEVRQTCIQFLINNSVAQSNNFKIKIKLKLEEIRKSEIEDLIVYEIYGIVSAFYLVLSGA